MNANHKTKHDLLIVRFSVLDICFRNAEVALVFLGKTLMSGFPVRTALMVYIVMVYIFMAYIVMASTVMALYSHWSSVSAEEL